MRFPFQRGLGLLGLAVFLGVPSFASPDRQSKDGQVVGEASDETAAPNFSQTKTECLIPDRLRTLLEELLSKSSDHIYAVNKKTGKSFPLSLRAIGPTDLPYFNTIPLLLPVALEPIIKDWVPEGVKLSEIFITREADSAINYNFHFDLTTPDGFTHRWTVNCDGKVIYYITGDIQSHQTHPPLPSLQKVMGVMAARPQIWKPAALNPILDKASKALEVGWNVFDQTKPRDDFVAGPLPSDNSGIGGPHMPTEGADVLKPGSTRLSIDANAANYLTNENNPRGSVVRKFEQHNISVELRKGFKIGDMPVFEVGGNIAVHQRGSDFLSSAIIEPWEKFAAGLSGNPKLMNPDRFGPLAIQESGETIMVGGKTRRQNQGSAGFSLGDLVLTFKTVVADAARESFAPKIAARLAVNIATGQDIFTSGNFVGAGVSLSKPLSKRATMHADARILAPMDKSDSLGLALKPAAFGATLGVEVRVGKKTSLGAQVNMDQSPYKKTGLMAFDATKADITFGISRLAKIGARSVLWQIYGREDFNIDAENGAYLRPSSPPDFQAGMRMTITTEKYTDATKR